MKASQQQSYGRTKTSLAVACLLNLLTLEDVARADQPVHCLKDDIFGTWDFHVNSQVNTVNLFQTKEVCTHQLPNKVQILSKDHKFNFPKEEIYRTQLLDGYKAQAQKCSEKGKCDGPVIEGTWSTIYDQAFRVELSDGQRFISNFRYNIKDSISDDPLQDGANRFTGIGAGDYINFDSKCNESMVGFVQHVHGNGSMKQHHAQCFYAQQVSHLDLEKSIEEEKDGVKIDRIIEKQGKPTSVLAEADPEAVAEALKAAGHQVTPEQIAQFENEMKAESETTKSGAPPDEQNVLLGQRKTHTRHNIHLEHVPTDETDLLISTINEMDLGWKADVCKYQKHHSNYGAHCDKPVMLAQTSSSEASEQQFGEGADFQAALGEAQKYMKNYPDAQSIPDSELPENFDWRSVGGFNFMNEHRDQGHCGSCYTVSFTQIAENRLKIKYGQEMPKLSAQYLMTCNYMNEGCDGGWPFFHGFLGENGYLVTEDCAPYRGKTKGDKCSNYEKCEPHSKIQNTYFIGKGYGDSTEKKMMKEIIRNGAVNGEMQAPRIFSLYQQGIFTSAGILNLHKKVSSQSLAQTSNTNISDKNLEGYGISWQNLNHSIVILGWGTDPQTGQKYWICRNSYGQKWGDGGDFLVARGNDEFAIESETTAYDPVLCSESQC